MTPLDDKNATLADRLQVMLNQQCADYQDRDARRPQRLKANIETLGQAIAALRTQTLRDANEAFFNALADVELDGDAVEADLASMNEAALRAASQDADAARGEIVEALTNLIDDVQQWCDAVAKDSSWDGWDHHYKGLAYDGLAAYRRALASSAAPSERAARIERVAEVLRDRFPFLNADDDMKDLARVILALSSEAPPSERANATMMETPLTGSIRALASSAAPSDVRLVEKTKTTALSSDLGISITELIQSVTGGKIDVKSVIYDAARYRWLRARDLETVNTGGIFIGKTPDNLVLNLEDADRAIDEAMSRAPPRSDPNAAEG
jgi:hypothetical protein